MKNYEGFEYINGGVCAASGFKANGLNCGLNPDKNKNDLCIVVSDTDCSATAVYTTNKVKGAPILVTKAHLEQTGGVCRAVIANSKNANTCNFDGVEKAEKMCGLAAEALGIDSEKVIVASTGVIGQILPIEPIESHIKELADGISYDGNEKAATAIMTTDTVKKEVAVSFDLGGRKIKLGGMAKGSGMICPNMATTLNFITTDAKISRSALKTALAEITKITYNCLSVDGDTSTNDMVCLFANGLADNDEICENTDEYKIFSKALFIVMSELTKMLAKDGEGATKLIECSVAGAPTLDTAITVAKSVIGSPLLKCAIFGEDANWGRILCAIGYADAEFDISKTDVDIRSEQGEISVCRNASGVPFSEEKGSEVLAADEIYIAVDLHQGSAEAKAWGCDLTYDYVKINGDYRS